MKRTFSLLATLALMLCGMTGTAQTDVTSQYLANAGFDTGWTTSDIAQNTVSNVEGWNGASTGDTWFYGGALSYAGGVKINSVSLGAGPDGNTSGGALGLSAGWGTSIRYTQAVTLSPGRYRISYKAYNANTAAFQCHNYIGFAESNGTTHYGTVHNFPAEQWTEETITLELTSPTSGTVSVGMGAVSGGSGANAKLFVDYIKIEAYNAAETLMPGTTVAPGTWTGNTGTYQNTYPEYYKGSHFTGDAMTHTTAVENGTYSADVYFHSHMAWISKVANDGDLNAYITANNVTRQVGIVNNTGFAGYEPTRYHLDDISVTDGNLVIKVGNSAEGGNWLTAKVDKITKMTTPYVSYGAFPLPTTAVTAGYWYQTTVPVAGDYTLTPSASTTLSYTQDATALTSGTFSTTTGGAIQLSAGTLYVKSDAAVTLSLAAANYGYEVGLATIDRTYVQGGETLTVSYPDAVTNDPSASLAVNTSGITFGGNAVTATATANGFTFTVPTVTAGSEYVLSIPAGAVAYAGHASSAAQTLTIKAPAVFDGTYYLQNQDGKYLSRGSSWGTHAIADDWGLPINVATDGEGHSTLQFLDSKVYLYADATNAWCDGTNTANPNTQWTVTLADGSYRLSCVAFNTTYVKMTSGDQNIYVNGTDASEIQQWTFELPSAHPAKMAALRTAATALSSEVSGLASKTYVEATTSATAEEYQGTSYFAGSSIVKGSIAVYPGIYKFSVPAFHRMSTNPVTLPMRQAGTECPSVFAYFGDAKVQLHSVYDATTAEAGTGTYTPDSVIYYPNNQATSLTAFKADSYVNEIWVRVTEATTLEYGIANQGVTSMDGRWTCYAKDGIEIVRYFDPNSEALSDGTDLTSLIKNPTIESTTETQIPAGWTGTTSSWRWAVGTGDTYMECWNGSAAGVNFNMYQTITGLQEGVYELSADMFNSSNDEALAAQFTGGECGLYAQTASAHAFVGVTTDGTELAKHTLYIYVKEGETLTLGVKNAATPTARWFGCDNFTLTYRTLDSATSDLVASVPTSQANSSLKSAMSSANMNLGNAATKTGDLFNALTSAIADVRVSAANYGHLLYALDNDDSRLAATPTNVQTEYASLKSELRSYYTNQTASADCAEEIKTVKASLAQALINTGESLTYLIVNNSFETGDLTGWTVSTYGDDTGVKTNGGTTYGTDGGDGTYLYNTWSSGDKGGYPLRQNIGYLPAGTYKLTGLVSTSAGTVFLLVNDYVSAGTASTDKTTFLTASMTFTLDGVTEVTIGAAGGDNDGLYTQSSYCWYKADNFQLNPVDEQGGGEEEDDDVKLTSGDYYARGSESIFGRFAVTGSSVSITEQGLCYSTENQTPTIEEDSKATDYISYCGKIFKISNLQPATAYYIRPYAVIGGETHYGKTHKVYTLPTGSITYTIRTSDNSTYDQNITNAITTWAEYWNRYTSISGYTCSAGFVDGVATADCSYGGWVRFGSNTSYQQCGTAMHENLHGIGMGTSTEWTNLGSGKHWAGPRVNEFIKFFENSDGATMYGDSQHAWCSNSNGGLSYTINGAHEDAYSDLQRTANSLLAQAYCEDGLRPTSGAYYFTPYYSVEQEDDDVFYIQNSSTGKYLVDSNGRLGVQAYSSLDDAKAAEVAAWTLTFDPATRWYHLTSVKNGNKLSHQNYVWGLNKEDENINIVKSVNTGKYWLNTPTTNGRNLLGDLSCGTTAPLDTTNANGQDWTLIRVTPEVAVNYGDVNRDGTISIADVTALVNIVLGKDSGDTPVYDHAAADVNQDGSISIADVTALVNVVLGK
ncbi:MAG: dockerin type I repeat-containing protein [Bacteroidaceae bacterium]|nr:dockerin type I repeat-containing protein [Bacteroidaceae bacterium]